ncbi:MAG TPA: YdeI/OmpD-associated family protein [Steroidobacteraceae bacterium]|nr:YdeI/OmpD-associated family protein [Steroidobacteraceae bacterium]
MPTKKTSPRTSPMVRFRSRLLKPESGKGGWSFLLLPKSASEKIPTRGQSAVDGALNGANFTAVLEPDGEGGHWLKVPKKLREAAAAGEGDIVTLEITPAAKDVEATVPADLRKALAATPKARTTWTDLTPAARRDWIFWITSAKQPETRARRIVNACDMLAGGKRRVCCFDRSGMYSKSLSAPKAAI